MKRKTLEYFEGCLLGGAVGDALGAPVEFMTLEEILGRFGPAGIGEFAQAYGKVGAITDDTQMTLFTAEGLIQSQADRGPGLGSGTFERISCLPAVAVHAVTRRRRQHDQPARHLQHARRHPHQFQGTACPQSTGQGLPVIPAKWCRGNPAAARQQQQGLRRRHVHRPGGPCGTKGQGL